METNKDVLLKAVADVLQEALNEFDTISKMPEQPAAPAPAEAPLAKFDISASEDPSKPAPAAASDDKDEDDKDEDKDEDDKKDKKDEDDKDDETLKSEFAALQKKMEARGLLQKSEPAKVEAATTPVAAAPAAEAPKTETVQKSETTPAAEKSEDLKKAVETIDVLQKTIADLTAKVEKIGSAPAPRRGAAGYAPSLRKNAEGAEGETEGFNLTKSQVIDKLIELKKSGKAVDTALINRVETNRMSDADVKHIKGLLG